MLNKENNSPYLNDILENNFEQLQINFPNDYEGKVVSTLVRKLSPKHSTKAVLYVHGFHDYFFQEELANEFIKHDYNFYAIDLRKSGRSLLNQQIPYNTHSISEYYDDIDAALKQIKAEGNDFIVINAHSTGGLTAALYLDKHKDACQALILNSPFLEMNKTWAIRKLGIPFIHQFAKIFPELKIKAGFSPFYGKSINKNYKGEWDYNLNWKPISISYLTTGWLSAIYKAHKAIKKGLNITCPILLMSSAKSIKNKVWIDDFKKADAVLNVEHIRKYAMHLGKNLTAISFENGLHDLILSEKSVRTQVYLSMFNWLDKFSI